MVETAVLITAFWLGLLTSVSPCPLASNIAAVSYIGGQLGSRTSSIASGLLYAAGRSLAYIAIAAILVAGLLGTVELSQFLQKYMNRLIGPLLILVGMVLLELISLPGQGVAPSERTKARLVRHPLLGATLLGFLFALSFCPISAAIYFGRLVPMALEQQSPILVPAVFALGTGLPVVLLAIVLSVSAESIGNLFHRIATFELWARRVTGVVFVGVGIYYSLRYIFVLW